MRIPQHILGGRMPRYQLWYQQFFSQDPLAFHHWRLARAVTSRFSSARPRSLVASPQTPSDDWCLQARANTRSSYPQTLPQGDADVYDDW